MALTKTQIVTLRSAVKFGFTFKNDSPFTSYRAGAAAVNGLVRQGFLLEKTNEFGTEYVPTDKAREFVKYGCLVSDPVAA